MENATIVKASRYPYAETISRLTKTILDAGNRIFATIDQSAAASSVGLSLRPTTLIVFGNPRGGTALMAAFPLFALELPLKLVVWEEQDSSVKVASMRVADIAKRNNLTGFDVQVAALDHAIATLAGSIAA